MSTSTVETIKVPFEGDEITFTIETIKNFDMHKVVRLAYNSKSDAIRHTLFTLLEDYYVWNCQVLRDNNKLQGAVFYPEDLVHDKYSWKCVYYDAISDHMLLYNNFSVDVRAVLLQTWLPTADSEKDLGDDVMQLPPINYHPEWYRHVAAGNLTIVGNPYKGPKLYKLRYPWNVFVITDSQAELHQLLEAINKGMRLSVDLLIEKCKDFSRTLVYKTDQGLTYTRVLSKPSWFKLNINIRTGIAWNIQRVFLEQLEQLEQLPQE